MSYIDRNLLANEQIQFRTRKHIILFFYPAMLVLIASYLSYCIRTMPIMINAAPLEWIPWVVALILWSRAGLDYWTSEFVVTNKRVMMREGFFIRHATELRISTIAQVNVDQSLLGQLLNYGVVALNAFGASDAFTFISRPFLFQRHVAEQLDKMVR